MIRALLVALVVGVAVGFLPPGLGRARCPSLGRRSVWQFQGAGSSEGLPYVGTTDVPDVAFDSFDRVYNQSVPAAESVAAPKPKKK